MVKPMINLLLSSVAVLGLTSGHTMQAVSGENPRLKYEPSVKYEKKITVMARLVKEVYEPTEPVPIVVGIANHSSEPVYLSTDRPGIFGTGADVKDANGVRMKGDPILTPPGAPLSHFMEKDGKSVYVQPVSKIKGSSLILALMPDALQRHQGYLTEGTYYLHIGSVEIIHEISDLIVRKDVPHRLWIGPQSKTIRSRHKLNTLKIEIRKKPKS